MSQWEPPNLESLQDESVFSERDLSLQYQSMIYDNNKAVRDNELNLRFNQLSINTNLRNGKPKEKMKVATKKSNNQNRGEDTWTDASRRNQETVEMIRACGIGSGVGHFLDSNNTLATCATKKSFLVINDFPVFIGEEFFKLHPRKTKAVTPEPFTLNNEELSTTDSSSSYDISYELLP